MVPTRIELRGGSYKSGQHSRGVLSVERERLKVADRVDIGRVAERPLPRG